jgi:hypothetical protein
MVLDQFTFKNKQMYEITAAAVAKLAYIKGYQLGKGRDNIERIKMLRDKR